MNSEPLTIEMPSFIKGNKEAEERWNEIFSNIGIHNIRPSVTKDNVIPPLIEPGEQDYINIYGRCEPPHVTFEEHENPFLRRDICRGLTKQMIWVDDSAFLDYNCWFIRERINLIKTRRTKHGKRKLIPYKASKILFKDVKPTSVAMRTNDDEDVMKRGGPINWSLDVKFECS